MGRLQYCVAVRWVGELSDAAHLADAGLAAANEVLQVKWVRSEGFVLHEILDYVLRGVDGSAVVVDGLEVGRVGIG